MLRVIETNPDVGPFAPASSRLRSARSGRFVLYGNKEKIQYWFRT